MTSSTGASGAPFILPYHLITAPNNGNCLPNVGNFVNAHLSDA